MKPEYSVLIEKLLEGSINESESQSLLEKIESKQIPIDELKVVIDMHGILYSEFHLDSQANNLHKIVARAISTKKPSLSDRVIRRIETKKQKNNYWVIAALLFFSILIGGLIVSKGLKTTISSDSWTLNSSSGSSIVVGPNFKNDTVFMQSYVLPDGSIIDLYPDTNVNFDQNILTLHKGKLQAEITKQKSPLIFKSGDSSCNIIGTKFILEATYQQSKPASELTVIEGVVEMHAFNKTELVKINQKCMATSYNQKIEVSDIKSNKSITDKQNSNIIYFSHFENNNIESFWQTWNDAESNLLKTPNKILLITNNNKLESYIESTIFKTFTKNVGYHIQVSPIVFKGSINIGLEFSNKGVPYHEDGFTIKRDGNKFNCQSYQILYGVKTVKEKASFTDNITPFFFNGTISHEFIKVDSNSNEPKENKPLLEDISFKIYVKQTEEGSSEVQINQVKVERLKIK